jgi:sugar phosphate isomerase/epimerase
MFMNVACGWLGVLFRYGYPPSIDNALEGISEVSKWGFDALEMEAVGEESLREMYQRRNEFRDRIDSLGLKVVNFCPVLPEMMSLDSLPRSQALGLFEMGCDLACYLGSPIVMTDSFEAPMDYAGGSPGEAPLEYGVAYAARCSPDFNWGQVWANLTGVISKCVEMAGKRDLRLAMECRVGEVVANTDAFLRLHDAVGSDRFGVVFDTAHLHAQKEILPLSVEKLQQRIFLVHASDNDGRENEHLAIGQGTIEWRELFGTMAKHHYGGSVVLDIGGVPDLRGAYLLSREFLQSLP